MLEESRLQLEEKGMTFEIKEQAKNFLIDKGYDEKYGARPLRRTIQREIEDPLANEILKGVFKKGSVITVDFQDDKISFVETVKKHKKKEREKIQSA
jgi:ATP-dependent Clp protease ATP-binding subunit ClpC